MPENSAPHIPHPLIGAGIHSRVQEELALIQSSEDVRVLHACESGSRAWGFASTDSMNLLDSVLDEPEVRTAVEALVMRKQAGQELDMEPPLPVLSDFLSAEITRLERLSEPEPTTRGTEELNAFFRRYAV